MKNIPVRFLFLLLFQALSPSLPLQAQSNLGNPPVLNFPTKVYKAGTQTWDIAIDRYGVTYFANNDGLLEFDGIHWRLHPLGNGTIARSVQCGDDQRVYVGGQGDFGYFAPDASGRLEYHSLNLLLPASEQNFGDVWDILVRSDGVFFRTSTAVFHLYKGQIKTFLRGKTLLYMGLLHEKVLIQGAGNTLYLFENGDFHTIGKFAIPADAIITATLPLSRDTFLITTLKNGIYYLSGENSGKWETQADEFLRENRIYCAALLPAGKIAVGTSNNGLVTLDRPRRIFNHLNKKNGLQNTTVLSLLACYNGSIWIGLDNGIDYADLASPFTSIFPDGDLQGTGYTAQLYEGKLYFGTNHGLFSTPWKPWYAPDERQKFTAVKNTEGQVWSLNILGNELLLGHHEGAFSVKDNLAKKLTGIQGIWQFLPIGENTALAGHYNGLEQFKMSAKGWAYDAPMTGLVESCRILATDKNGDIWMSHPYRGIFRISADIATHRVVSDFFNSSHGLPSDLNNYLFKLGDKIVFAGERGVFHFDARAKRFVPNEKFNAIFGKNNRVKYLRQDKSGNIWYVAGNETGVILIQDNALEKTVRRIPIPELTGKLTGGFEFINPLDARNVCVATRQGFMLFNLEAYLIPDTVVQLVLQEVRLKNESDSLLFGGHNLQDENLKKTVLSSGQNALGFYFSVTNHPGSEFIRYSHFLEGTERGWSDWGPETELVFNNLRPGNYIFHVKARNQHGAESAVLSYPFEILPPWYAGKIAYAIYSLLLLSLLAGIIYGQRLRFESEKEAMQSSHRLREEQHLLQVRRSEEAINRLQNEKLEAEVSHKNQELASATLHLVKKNEILNTIRGALERLKQRVSSQTELEKEIGRIIKLVEEDASIDADWEQFSHNFDLVHSDFLKRLGEQFPQISPNDFKLCAYLRMNLSSKEIAAMMNISVRGVEASRYRLRKRLGLETDTNLTEFLMKF